MLRPKLLAAGAREVNAEAIRTLTEPEVETYRELTRRLIANLEHPSLAGPRSGQAGIGER